MDYKIRVNRPCRLFIDGEEIQVLNELQLTKIDLAPGEYLRKVVAIDNPSIFNETVLSISSSKVDLITLDTIGLEDAKSNALSEEKFLVGNLYYEANEDRTGVSVCKYDKNFPPKDLIIPDTINYAGYNYSVTSIGGWAFRGCKSLTSVTIPNTMTIIGNETFCGCSSLTSVTIPNSVTSIGDYAFCGCSSLTSITIPNSVTSIGWGAFKNCSSLTSITIPNSVTSIEEDAFDGTGIYTNAANWKNGALYINNCLIGVQRDSIGDYIIKAGTRLIAGGAFCECSLTSITIPNSVTSIGFRAFDGCTSLTSITIPNSVKSIGSFAFYGCTSLTSITIPNSMTSIEDDAFNGCSSLTSITIPNSVKSIGVGAFESCSSLTSITIPNSVTSIGYAAFLNCDSLTSIQYTGTKEQWNKIELSNFWAKESGIEVIHCTDGEIRL